MMKSVNYIFFALLLSCPSLFPAQNSAEHRTIWKMVQQDIFSSAYDAAFVLTAPLRFSGRDWAITGALAGGTAAIFPPDEPIRDFMKQQHGKIQDQIMDIGQRYGTGVLWRISSGTFYAGGLILRNDDIRTTGRLLFEAELMAQFISSQGKILFGRSRPYEGEGAFKFRPLQDLLGASLPSGHAITASTFATIMARRLHNLPLGIVLYGLAGVTAVSRVYNDAHWTSDVVLGSALGYFLGTGICVINEKPVEKTHWRMIPALNGFAVQYRF